MSGRVAIFGPQPILSVTLESLGTGGDDLHVHPAGQGVWVARMAAELGAHTVLCGLLGGETGDVLEPLLERMPGERRLVRMASASPGYVIDRRSGERKLVGQSVAGPPSRHEVDELFSATCAAALGADVLVVCNPYADDALPAAIYGDLVSDVRGNGTTVIVDLSSPRLESALEGRPDVVKLNDWELAEYVVGPVSEPAEMRAAAKRLLDAGAGAVVVTRAGQPALVLDRDGARELVPPRFERGAREGCGDSMAGAMAAGMARGMPWEDVLVLGAAAGAANFLHHGLGSGSRGVVEELVSRVELRPAPGQEIAG